MIDFFESSVRINPDSVFFSFVQEDGCRISYTYWQARLISASLARKLQAAGLRSGDVVSIDLPNCPEFVFVVLACAYSGLVMVLLDNALPEGEKLSRTLDIERLGKSITCKIDPVLVRQVLRNVRNLPDDEAEIVRGIYGMQRKGRAIMGEGQDAIDDTVHFAERAAHLFDRESLAVMVFAGGGQNRSASKVPGTNHNLKTVPLTWANLMDASDIANGALAAGAVRLLQERLPFNSVSLTNSGRVAEVLPEVIWQCVLSLSSIDGFQVLTRSVVSRSPFMLYGERDVEPILRDAESGYVTHIAVDDAVLQDILTIEEWRSDAVPGISSRLARYRCVLITGRKVHARTIQRAYEAGARLFVGYGLPQTSGVIAASRVSPSYDGGLASMDGYEVRIVDPDDEGFGRLAVRGPGVFGGYPNTRTAFTVDRFFITEDKASLVDGLIRIRSRAENMFVCDGQNVFPVEIADVLRHVAGVTGVHVFGVPDSRYGMVPVAVIERNDPDLTPQTIEQMTHQWFSSITVPISIFVFDQLPRTAQGKLDRPAIEAIFNT